MAPALAHQGHHWISAQFTCQCRPLHSTNSNPNFGVIALTLPPPVIHPAPLRRYRAVGMLDVTKL